MRSTDNLLLSRMPPAVAGELLESGGDFELANGCLMPSDQLSGGQVFIVAGGVASKFQIATGGKISEIGMVGPEGLFPLAGILDVPGAPHIVLAQIGTLIGRRVRTKDFQRIVGESPEARQLVLRYSYAFVTQICSNLLVSDQPVSVRLARWLLMCHDRSTGDNIEVTHDTLALMTISHRPTISHELQIMRDDGLIEMSRGRIDVRDRAGLLALSGGSYGATENNWRDNIGEFGKT